STSDARFALFNIKRDIAQYLHRAQVTYLLIDDRCPGSAKRMRPVVLPAQSDPGDPFINEPSILPSTDMIGMIGSGLERRSRRACRHGARAMPEYCREPVRGARTERVGRSSAELRSRVYEPGHH